MKTITYIFALALLATMAACSDSNQQQKSNTSNSLCSIYDPRCGISQVPGMNNTPGDHSPNPRPTAPF